MLMNNFFPYYIQMSFFNWIKDTANNIGQKINSGVQFLGQKAKDAANFVGQKVLPAVEGTAKFAKDVLVPIGNVATEFDIPFAKALTGYIDKGADWVLDHTKKAKNGLEKVSKIADSAKDFDLKKNGIDKVREAREIWGR